MKTARTELMEEFHIEHLRDSMGQSLSGVNVLGNAEIARALAADQIYSCSTNRLPGLLILGYRQLNASLSTCADSGLGVLITKPQRA